MNPQDQPTNIDEVTYNEYSANESSSFVSQSEESNRVTDDSVLSWINFEPQHISTPISEEKVRTLFVSGLALDTKAREIVHLFGRLEGYEGSMLKKGSTVGKIFTPVAFVTFETREMAEKAKEEMKGIRFDPNLSFTLNVEFARSNSMNLKNSSLAINADASNSPPKNHKPPMYMSNLLEPPNWSNQLPNQMLTPIFSPVVGKPSFNVSQGHQWMMTPPPPLQLSPPIHLILTPHTPVNILNANNYNATANYNENNNFLINNYNATANNNELNNFLINNNYNTTANNNELNNFLINNYNATANYNENNKFLINNYINVNNNPNNVYGYNSNNLNNNGSRGN